MVTMKEINPHSYPTTPEQDLNLQRLLKALNSIRSSWGKPMIVTSGLRSQQDQERINPSAPKSKHLIGAAADIKDDGSLYKWLETNPKAMELAGIYCEVGTNGWVHIQVLPPKSGKRWFLP
jgi:uncharacterized protein YcbK (DUF882 family)